MDGKDTNRKEMVLCTGRKGGFFAAGANAWHIAFSIPDDIMQFFIRAVEMR
jgi:hypothetical protein